MKRSAVLLVACAAVFAAGFRLSGQPADPRRARITAAHHHSCVARLDGRVMCWGDGGEGQLGADIARTAYPREAMRPTDGGAGAPREVTGGGWHTCGLGTAGHPVCWGLDDRGQLGPWGQERGSVDALDQPLLSIEAHVRHTCAVASDAKVYCWGDNDRGQLGNGGLASGRTPTPVQSSRPFASVTVGGSHACALTQAGEAYCWGSDEFGETGTGRRRDVLVPRRVERPERFTVLSAGGHHTCGVTVDEEIVCWGANQHGQLGNGSPVRVPHPESAGSVRWASVHAGTHHTCALSNTGQAFCWGDNSMGQLGAPADGPERGLPRPVDTPLRFSSLDAGTQHTCAIDRGGGVWCWGRGLEGQLGHGRFENSPVPVRAAID